MAAMKDRFADLLTNAIHTIATQDKRTIAAIQDELGYDIGRDSGGSAIEYWRKGNTPKRYEELDKLTGALVKRKGLSHHQCQDFLHAADHPNAERLLQRLFPPVEINLSADAFNRFVAGPPITRPYQFFGREPVLKRIFNTWRGFPLEHFAIIGLKRSGKTSLLYQIMKITQAMPEDVRPGQRTNYLPQADRFRWAIVNFQDPRRRNQEKLFRFLLTELNMPVPDLCNQDNFLDIIGNHLKTPAVIMMDELQAGLADDRLDEDFWWCLRAASQDSDGMLAFVLTATKSPMIMATDEHKPSPFFNIFHSLMLEPFTEAEAQALMANSPKPIDAASANWIMAKSGCWPSLLQILCQTYVHAIQNNEPDELWQAKGLDQMKPYSYLLTSNTNKESVAI